ncbi:MAG TPA: rhomboid family intramembrane serine protease [Candidatus Dormibacteraeota bacterium]|nr:rhomboid family intramembrane serine protease [Candidatus Dormibacteraeota bacterium]
MPLSPRARFKLERLQKQLSGFFSGQKAAPRPKICPACGTLVGATATRCHQCGASLTFGLAAASKSIGKLLPETAPVTYSILTMCCAIYVATLIVTVRQTGFAMPTGGLFGVFNLGAISSRVLVAAGASLPLAYNLHEPWRFLTAVFLHASILHIGFNMWVLMDIGPAVEEMYGSARYFFIFVVTGVGGYVLSSFFGNFSIGASGALLGLIGVLLAMSVGRKSSGMQMLRSQMIRWLIYILVFGLVMRGIDNYAHVGGFITGFILGKLMASRPPASTEERKRAYAMGWAAGLAVVVSFAMVFWGIFVPR